MEMCYTCMLCENNINDGILLDLGCGTGTMTELFAGFGYDMIGVDNSADMLEIAMEKKEASGHDILYLLQDMRAFELYGTVRAVLSVCDSVNYMTDHKYRDVMGDCTIAEDRGECSFIWDNYYYEDERINEYDLTLFIREPGHGPEELYRKYRETHYQRGYTLEEIKGLLKEAGLIFLDARDMDTEGAAADDSERICVTARESGKQDADPRVCGGDDRTGGGGQTAARHKPGGDGGPRKAADRRRDDGQHDEKCDRYADHSDQMFRSDPGADRNGGQPGECERLCI